MFTHTHPSLLFERLIPKKCKFISKTLITIILSGYHSSNCLFSSLPLYHRILTPTEIPQFRISTIGQSERSQIEHLAEYP